MISIALDDHPHTRALTTGAVQPERVALAFAEMKPARRVFRAMVREHNLDVSELPIGALVLARAHGRPLVLVPATLHARPLHATLICSAARPLGPAELAGKTIGVRSHAQTTAIWVRGLLANDYGLDLDSVRWVVFEDDHVPEHVAPPSVLRAPRDADMLAMLRAGALDAAIHGQGLPDDPAFVPVIADHESAAARWRTAHGFVPINHMVVASERFARSNPDGLREIFRLLVASKHAASLAERDDFPFGFTSCAPALAILLDYCLQQRLLPRRLEVDELFDNTTRALEAE